MKPLLASGARVKLSMDGFQTLLIDVGVNLGCGNVGMPKQLLNDPQIGPIPKQVRGKTMPQQMRIDIFFQSSALRYFFNDLPNACGG